MVVLQVSRPRLLARDVDGAGGDSMSSVFDEAALARLRELDPGGRRGFVAQVMTTFETSMRRNLARIDGEAPDPGLAAEVAHTLKSSSAAIGALELSACCGRLEKLARAADGSDIMPAVHALRSEGQRVLGAVRAMLRP